jgi:hypothetical protein
MTGGPMQPNSYPDSDLESREREDSWSAESVRTPSRNAPLHVIVTFFRTSFLCSIVGVPYTRASFSTRPGRQ